MWHKTPTRVLGAIFAVILTATACGSDAATETTSADDASSDEAMSDETMADEAMSDETMSDDEMSDDDVSEEDHDDEHDDHGDGGEHGAPTIDVDPSNPIPEVAMVLNETDESGVYDLRVILANFTITPENIDGEPVDNEGHMHLLIDGEKVERFTDLERQIKVPEGEHLVEVELNANNHAAYAIDGTPIRTGMTVTGSGDASNDDHDHDHSDANAAIEDGLSASDADATIRASYVDGAVSIDGEDRVEVATGDVVMIMISSDVAEEAHLHGYDILANVSPDSDGMILFTANTPGRFEIEFEQSGTFIAELVVS